MVLCQTLHGPAKRRMWDLDSADLNQPWRWSSSGQAKIYRGSIARDPVMVVKSAKGPGKRSVPLIACP